MREITKKFNVYKFNELKKEVQNEVLKRQIEEEFQFYIDFLLEDDMTEEAKLLLHDTFKGAEYKSVCYDLSYEQGSGAIIEFEISIDDINKKYNILTDDEIKKIENIGYSIIKIKHSGRYCHEYAFEFDFQDYTYYIDDFENTQQKLEDMMTLFKKDVVIMNEKAKRIGYDLIENIEYFKDLAKEKVQELEFFKGGSVYYEKD